jgi:hypothetical protein
MAAARLEARCVMHSMTALNKPVLVALAATCLVGFGPTQAQQQPGGTAQSISTPPQPYAASETSTDTAAGESATELAKKLQNPIGDLISVPFQNNTNFNVGPSKGTQNILNIQPVIPFHLNDDWNLITRTIVPLVWSPSFQPGQSVPPFGLAPTSFSALFSPKNPVDGWVWGIGPVAQLPTATSKNLGSNVWGLGPAAVVVKLAGPIVTGALVNNVFSLGGTSGRGATQYSGFTFNPFFVYNLGKGWFVGSVPVITATWPAPGNKAWTVPVGMQGGRLIKIGGKLPVNLLVGAYYNAVRPEFGPTWQLRTQIAFIF